MAEWSASSISLPVVNPILAGTVNRIGQDTDLVTLRANQQGAKPDTANLAVIDRFALRPAITSAGEHAFPVRRRGGQPMCQRYPGRNGPYPRVHTAWT